MATRASVTARRSQLTILLSQRDDYGLVLLLIIATIVVISLGLGALGQFVSVCLSGFTLLFVLHTSDARQRSFRAAAVIVAVAIASSAAALFVGREHGTAAAGLIGLMLAFVAPIVILRRILRSPTITVKLVLGALSIYLLLGLTYSYLYPLIGYVTGGPFFVQTSSATSIDYVYFSYVTLTTVGYGDFTAASSAGRMIAVSEALTGQLYLVSAVALLVGNIGRTIARGGPATGAEIASEAEPDAGMVQTNEAEEG
jgi:Ion channel